MFEPTDFRRLFSEDDGDFATVCTGRARIERRRLGMIQIPDGRIHACDPLVPMEPRPFAEHVDPGTYEVVLFVAVRTDPQASQRDLERNVAAALVFASGSPVKWTRASREGDAESGAYGVDAGTGAFMGSRASALVCGPDDSHGDRILAARRQAGSGVIVEFDDGVAMAAFDSGDGDGFYESWWGFDAAGVRCMLLTDFAIPTPAGPHVESASGGSLGSEDGRDGPAADGSCPTGRCSVTRSSRTQSLSSLSPKRENLRLRCSELRMPLMPWSRELELAV